MGFPLPLIGSYLEGGRITTRTELWTGVPGYPDPVLDYVPARAAWRYDARGNLERYQDVEGPRDSVVTRSASRSYYGADGKLMVYQVSRDSIKTYISDKYYSGGILYNMSSSSYTELSNWGAYEEYGYDALGRRVWKRSRQEAPVCQKATRCFSSIERTIWDGDQVLWELRDTNLSGPASPAVGERTGKIGYVHAGEIDAPLGMIRNGSTIVLHRDVRGQYMMATALNGGVIEPGIIWPGDVWSVQDEITMFTIDDPHRVRPWYGSLIMGQADASGLSYRRNRYYSPSGMNNP
jgi:hypothetical protein